MESTRAFAPEVFSPRFRPKFALFPQPVSPMAYKSSSGLREISPAGVSKKKRNGIFGAVLVTESGSQLFILL
jgi:hypothetical protein